MENQVFFSLNSNMPECDLSGVYFIKNIIDGKMYIGSSKHIEKRLREHIGNLNNNKHCNRHLQFAWNKYGENNFRFGIIEETDDDSNFRIKKEQECIDYFETSNQLKGYNLAHARGGVYHITDATKEKIRKAHTGKKMPEKYVKELSARMSGSGNPFYGRTHKKESKEKMSASHKGKKLSEETKQKLKKCGGTKYYTAETYKKLSLANRGENSSSSILKESDVICILQKIKNGEMQRKIAKEYNVRESEITRIKQRKRWGYLYEIHPELY